MADGQDDRLFWAVFAVALGALGLFWHPGSYINDEVAQAAGLHELRHGNLGIDGEFPPGYAPFVRTGYRHWLLPDEDDPGLRVRPVDSTMLNVLALPILLVLEGTAWALGYDLALAAWQSVALGFAIWRGTAFAPTLSLVIRQRWAVLPGLVLLLGSAGRAAEYPGEPFLQFAALQAVNMVAGAFAIALLFDLLRAEWPARTAAPVVLLLALSSPLLFWFASNKDTGLTIALVVAAAWCYRRGARTSPSMTFLAFAVAGLALWSHLQYGLVLIASLGLVALPAVWLSVSSLVARAAAGIAGVSLGLLLEGTERALLRAFDIRLGSGLPIPGLGGDPEGQTVLEQAESGQLSHSVLSHPFETLDAWRQLIVWADWIDLALSLSFVTIFPLLAVALFRLRDSAWRPVHPSLRAWTLVYAVVLLAVSGPRIVQHGPGFDMRYAATFWPAVVLWTAPIVMRATERIGVRPFLLRTAMVAVCVLVGTLAFLAIALTLVQRLTFAGNLYDQVVVMRYLGMACAVALAYAGCLWALRKDVGRAWDVLVPAAVGIAIQFQVELQLVMIRSWSTSAPFVAWPVELVAKLANFLAFPA